MARLLLVESGYRLLPVKLQGPALEETSVQLATPLASVVRTYPATAPVGNMSPVVFSVPPMSRAVVGVEVPMPTLPVV